MTLTTRWSATLLFLAVAVVWGLNYLFVKAGLLLSAPLWLAAGRATIGALGIAVLWAIRPPREQLDIRGRRDALLMGVPNTGLFFGLWFVAANEVLPGETAVIVYTFPLWVVLLAGPVLHGPRMSAVALGAVGTGFLGVVLLSQPWAVTGAPVPILAVAELLLGALSWAVGTVLLQRRFASDQLAEANLWQLTGGSLLLVAAATAFEPTRFPAFSWPLAGTLLWLGLVGTAFAYGVWFWLLGSVPASRLSAYTFLVPVVALAASAIVFAERLDAVQVGGVAMVLGSLFVLGRRGGPARDLQRAETAG